jgi:hypothetical protein
MNIRVECESEEIVARTISYRINCKRDFIEFFILLVKLIFIWQGEQDLDQIPHCFAVL